MKKIFPLILALVIINMVFFTGIHDIDNAWNMSRINNNFVDCGLIGQCFNSSELYNVGITCVLVSFIFLVVISMEIGKEMERDIGVN